MIQWNFKPPARNMFYLTMTTTAQY